MAEAKRLTGIIERVPNFGWRLCGRPEFQKYWFDINLRPCKISVPRVIEKGIIRMSCYCDWKLLNCGSGEGWRKSVGWIRRQMRKF